MELEDTNPTQPTLEPNTSWVPTKGTLPHGDNQVCGVRCRFGKAPALLPDVMVEHGAGEHPDPRAGNIPAFLTSDIASVAPVNSVCV